jgi:hypothetical protein
MFSNYQQSTIKQEPQHMVHVSMNEIQRQCELAQHLYARYTISLMFERIRNRLVQQQHQQVSTFPLGIVPLETFREWFGESIRTKHYRRPTRELNGRKGHDLVEVYEFKDLEVGNIPYCKHHWNHIHYQEIGDAERRLYFCITKITFMYNTAEQYLTCTFSYIVWQPIVEKLDETSHGLVIPGIEEVDGYNLVWRPA